MAGVTLLRLKKEMEMIEKDPPPGCSAWAAGDSVHELEAVIQGADDTPYAKGCFRLRITVPQRYPFEPPKVHFVTPIYHPNIDSAGRICLDILNMPDGNGKGAWKPSLNLKTVLLSIRLLMSEPNPDDGLMVDITHEYIHNRALFERTAVERTRLHATEEGGRRGRRRGAGGVGAAGGGDGGERRRRREQQPRRSRRAAGRGRGRRAEEAATRVARRHARRVGMEPAAGSS